MHEIQALLCLAYQPVERSFIEVMPQLPTTKITPLIYTREDEANARHIRPDPNHAFDANSPTQDYTQDMTQLLAPYHAFVRQHVVLKPKLVEFISVTE